MTETPPRTVKTGRDDECFFRDERNTYRDDGDSSKDGEAIYTNYANITFNFRENLGCRQKTFPKLGNKFYPRHSIVG